MLLTKVMMAMDDAQTSYKEAQADNIRDILDDIWFKELTDEERKFLNNNVIE